MLRPIAALTLLHLSLTFYNVWPTLAIRWQAEWSVELALGVLLLAMANPLSRRAAPRGLSVAAAVWLLLVVGRYFQVMAPALYGREVNLYWDLQHVGSVVAMIARVASAPMLAGGAIAAIAVVTGGYLVGRWALGHVARALTEKASRRLLVVASLALIAFFAVGRLRPEASVPVTFVTPVVSTYARQIALALEGLGHGSAGAPLPESPEMSSDLDGIRGADVVVLFIESYGAVSFDRPSFTSRLAQSRATLTEAVVETDRGVVSAFVTSPTFGGSSWLAHISLMTGIEVRDPDTNARLMTQRRDTLATFFRSRGYRAVAVMPGLSQNWPEGAFYQFDDVLDASRLGYRGPEFGWWTIPDQFSLAQLRALELRDGGRAPVFAMLPTISTHTPFKPTPPYQADWSRVTTPEPFDVSDVERSMSEEPDWDNLSPSYADALEYAYRTLAGFLRETNGRDLVLVVLGDHQPPALVSGEGARWEVPVHVITHRRDVLDALAERGFRPGLSPTGESLGPMHGLVPHLMAAFGGGASALSEASGGR